METVKIFSDLLKWYSENEEDTGVNVYKIIAENWGGFASFEDGFVIVHPTDGSNGWSVHTALENAEYLVVELINDGWGDAKILK